MVTAILPSMVPKGSYNAESESSTNSSHQSHGRKDSHSRMAGFVGLFTGVGALLAVGVYLPLPSRLQRVGKPAAEALADTYYIAGGTSIAVAIACYLGLVSGTDNQSQWSESIPKVRSFSGHITESLAFLPKALTLGITKPSLGLGYLASFVARSSSVGISLFIPLFVNARLCDQPAHDVGDVKRHCRQAYVIAAQLSGVSQLFALLFAPIFGYFPFRHNRFHVPLAVATLLGFVGYIVFAKMNTSEASPTTFVVMAVLGISQIGAIVSSLSLVSGSVMEEILPPQQTGTMRSNITGADEETVSLLHKQSKGETHEFLKGTIAGVYSFAGSLAILILTKLGGYLFDRLGPASPFYLLALFNLILLLAVFGCGVLESYKGTD